MRQSQHHQQQDFRSNEDEPLMSDSVQTIPRLTPNINDSKLQATNSNKKQKEAEPAEGAKNNDANGKDIDVEQLDDDHSCKVRMQSGKKPITNATILRDHIQEIKQVFYKFADQHNKLLES